MGRLDTFTGWPTRAELPARSYFIAGTVSEPEPGGDGGAIRVWVIPPSGDGGPFAYAPDHARPRAFELPYSRALHRQVQAANELRARGQDVELRAVQAAPGNRRAGRAKGARGSAQPVHNGFRAYRLPPPTPPGKGGPAPPTP